MRCVLGETSCLEQTGSLFFWGRETRFCKTSTEEQMLPFIICYFSSKCESFHFKSGLFTSRTFTRAPWWPVAASHHPTGAKNSLKIVFSLNSYIYLRVYKCGLVSMDTKCKKKKKKLFTRPHFERRPRTKAALFC